jgi:cystathionine gamma-synthase
MPKLDTLLAHAGCEVDATTGEITQPIHFSSTFELETEMQFSRGFIYARCNNPTRHLLEKNVAALDEGQESAAFSSGILQTVCVHANRSDDSL